MAGPLRFRRSTETWHRDRVESQLRRPLANTFGASLRDSQVPAPPEYTGCRLEMDNGDLALFAYHDDTRAYWLGNTETPKVLWQTDKESFGEAPYPITRWAQRELLAELEASDPWLAAYDHVAWFFLPVLFSKDGRETSREFFRAHASGFPDASRDEGLAFYQDLLSTGILDEHRYTMASKLGTSQQSDLVRMRAAMAELNAAGLLHEAGYAFTPEIELPSGYALDYRADGDTLVEVTRPEPPRRRRAGGPIAAIRETVDNKTGTQLAAHERAVVFVDCTSFRDAEWAEIAAAEPSVGHEPAVVYRYRPDGTVAGYERGQTPLSVATAFDR